MIEIMDIYLQGEQEAREDHDNLIIGPGDSGLYVMTSQRKGWCLSSTKVEINFHLTLERRLLLF